MNAVTLLLLVALGMGAALVRRRLSHAAFFAADHRASAWLAGLAGTAIGLSAFTFVGGPALVAEKGFGALWMILPAPFTGVLQCWVLGGWLVNRQRRALTLPSVLREDYGDAVQGTAAVLVGLGCLAGVAVQAKAVAVLSETLLGGSGKLWAVWVLLATVAYLAAGGMGTAVWVDALFGLGMGVVALVLTALALHHAHAIGALATLWQSGKAYLGFFGQVPPAQALAWYSLFTLGTLAQPHYLQKFLFLRSARELSQLPFTLTASLMTVLTVWVGVGVAALALVTSGSLPAGGDQVVPLLLQRLGKGAVTATVLACFFAIMSTVATLLNMLVAAVAYDLPLAFGRAPWSVTASRALTVIGGMAGTGLGLASSRTVALLGLLGWGFFTAALLPAVLLARLRLGTSRGMIGAMVTGGGFCLLLETVRDHLTPGMEPGLLGAALGLLVGASSKGRQKWNGLTHNCSGSSGSLPPSESRSRPLP